MNSVPFLKSKVTIKTNLLLCQDWNLIEMRDFAYISYTRCGKISKFCLLRGDQEKIFGRINKNKYIFKNILKNINRQLYFILGRADPH